MPTPESSNAPPEFEKLAQALGRLLDCPDLNLDELEEETYNAIEEARRALGSIDLLQ